MGLWVNEIFVSVDGEVNQWHQGGMTTFIRLAGCNLNCPYCFGVMPGKKIPKITLAYHPNKKIYDIKKGDILLTFNKDQELVETTVIETHQREVGEWMRIKIHGTDYFVTPEHPFFTNRGLVNAKNLIIGDMIYHAIPNDKLSYRIKNDNNPMRDKEIATRSATNTDYKKTGQKISKTIKKKQEQGTYKPVWDLLTEDQKERIKQILSDNMKGVKNPNWKGGINTNCNFLKQEIKNGNITDCSRCDSKKPLDVHHKDGNNQNDDWNNLDVLCESCHYSDHQIGYNFWENERKDGKRIRTRNGFKVQKIKRINRSDYPPSIRPKPLKVYNLTCHPYNTYLVDYMWVHNCDTQRARTTDDAKIYPIEALYNLVKQIGCPKVTITGGEPLMQESVYDLIHLLTKDHDRQVTVETNGSIPIRKAWRHNWVVDYKLGIFEAGKMIHNNYVDPVILKSTDWVKMVIDESTLDLAISVKRTLQDEGCIARFAFSPKQDEESRSYFPQEIIKRLIKEKIWDVHLNLQLHKIIWPIGSEGSKVI